MSKPQRRQVTAHDQGLVDNSDKLIALALQVAEAQVRSDGVGSDALKFFSEGKLNVLLKIAASHDGVFSVQLEMVGPKGTMAAQMFELMVTPVRGKPH